MRIMNKIVMNMPPKYRGKNSETGSTRGSYRKYTYESEFGAPEPDAFRGHLHGRLEEEFDRVFHYLDHKGTFVTYDQGVKGDDDSNYTLSIFHFAGATVSVRGEASYLWRKSHLCITLASNDDVSDLIEKFRNDLGIEGFKHEQ